MKQPKPERVYQLRYILISLSVLTIAIVLGAVATIVLSLIFKSDATVQCIVGSLEGIIGAIATGLVLLQLRAAADVEVHQNQISQASFILQYNQAIFQDANMNEVERLLEDQAYFDEEPREILTKERRQKFINYLVYLESLAPLVANNVFTLENIDNLMAYRFFLAVDNVEVQTKEMLPFAEYYRGCFQLYKQWRAYRLERGLSCPCDDCRNTSAMRPLDQWEHFEVYATAPVKKEGV